MNPYSPPAEGFAAAPPAYAADRAGPTETTLDLLRQTRPWVLFLGVMSFIGSAFLLLGGLGSIVLGAIGGEKGPLTMLIGVVYVPMAFLYVYPGLKLWQYGSAIGRLMTNRTSEDLEAALTQQKSFWKFAGILTIVLMVVYALLMVIMVGVGVFAASRLPR